MALEMTVEHLDGTLAVATITGALTLGTSLKTVDQNLQSLVAGGVTRLVLDLSGCPYCDSAGLGLLVHALGLLAGRGGTMRLCGTTERVTALLKLTRTDSLLQTDPDRAASLAAI